MAAGPRAIQRARSIRPAEDLVAVLERIAEIPVVDLDRIVERLLRTDPQPPLDVGPEPPPSSRRVRGGHTAAR